MTAKTDRILRLLDDLDTDETVEVANEVLGLLGIDQIVEIILELDDLAKAEIAAHLDREG